MRPEGPRAPRARQRGFTLVEVLVVLIITGLVSSILFEGLSQSVRIRRTAGIELSRVQRDAMKVAWYRQVVNALVPDYPDGTERFKGGPTAFTGLSTASVGIVLDSAAPVAMALAIDVATNTTSVRVTTVDAGGRGTTVELLKLDGSDYAFRYLDDQDQVNNEWPRRTLAPTTQLPAAIWIVDGTGTRATSEVLVANIAGPRDQQPRLPPIILNSGAVP
jgi:prepilin-type N-terminal cleavage/methylation domain-containing protein